MYPGFCFINKFICFLVCIVDESIGDTDTDSWPYSVINYWYFSWKFNGDLGNATLSDVAI